MHIDLKTGAREKVIDIIIVTEPVWHDPCFGAKSGNGRGAGHGNEFGGGCGHGRGNGFGLSSGYGRGLSLRLSP